MGPAVVFGQDFAESPATAIQRALMGVDDTALPAGWLGSRGGRQERLIPDTVFGYSNISEVN
jgi:hypothetical protein